MQGILRSGAKFTGPVKAAFSTFGVSDLLGSLRRSAQISQQAYEVNLVLGKITEIFNEEVAKEAEKVRYNIYQKESPGAISLLSADLVKHGEYLTLARCLDQDHKFFDNLQKIGPISTSQIFAAALMDHGLDDMERVSSLILDRRAEFSGEDKKIFDNSTNLTTSLLAYNKIDLVRIAAIQKESPQAVRILGLAGVDMNRFSEYDDIEGSKVLRTPIQTAAINGNISIVRALLNVGANPILSNNAREDALVSAIFFNSDILLIKELFHNIMGRIGADAPDSLKITSYFIAAMVCDRDDVLGLLLNNSIINRNSKDLKKALVEAVKHENITDITSLIEDGVIKVSEPENKVLDAKVLQLKHSYKKGSDPFL